MQVNKSTPATIDEYITQYPPDVQQILTRIRAVIHETVPLAGEKISYGMPCFYMNGNLVWFGVILVCGGTLISFVRRRRLQFKPVSH